MACQPGPSVEEEQQMAHVYSFLDAYSGYYQIKLDPADRLKTAFITPFGAFCYLLYQVQDNGPPEVYSGTTLFYLCMTSVIPMNVLLHLFSCPPPGSINRPGDLPP